MSPGIRTITEPEATMQFQQGYKEGFEAGKAALKKELKHLIKQLKDVEAYTTSSGTFIR